MNKINMPELRVGNLVARIPIIQGGMGVGISLSGLASAVANEGGIGVISAVGIGIDKCKSLLSLRELNLIGLRDEIRTAREKSNGIIGVNIMYALTDFDDLIRVSFEEKVDIIFMGAGLPVAFPQDLVDKYFGSDDTKLGVIVSSGRAAKLIMRTWLSRFKRLPDIIVVEGPQAGGHLGFKPEQIDDPEYSLKSIVPDVVKTVKEFSEKTGKTIPVVAGGGIYSGEDIYKVMEMGADGVQMGSRFVATYECDATDEFKNKFIECEETDISIIKSPLGLPGRAIGNEFLTDVALGKKVPFKCPWKCLKTCQLENAPYCIAVALSNAKFGLMNQGFAFCGAKTYLIDKIQSVKSLISELNEGFNNLVREIGPLSKG